MSDDEADAEAWAVMLNGQRRAGAAAMMAGLDQYVPAGLPVFSALSSLPGLRQLTERGYGWVARNRHTLVPGLACAVGYRPPSLEPAVVDELQRRMGLAVNPPRR